MNGNSNRNLQIQLASPESSTLTSFKDVKGVSGYQGTTS